jgi:hypothetical protein
MQYALLIYEDEAAYRDENGRAWQEIIAQHEAFAGELVEKGLLRGGAGLKTANTATTVRRSRRPVRRCTTGRSPRARNSWAAST